MKIIEKFTDKINGSLSGIDVAALWDKKSILHFLDKWVSIGKSISDFHLYAGMSKTVNQNILMRWPRLI